MSEPPLPFARAAKPARPTARGSWRLRHERIAWISNVLYQDASAALVSAFCGMRLLMDRHTPTADSMFSPPSSPRAISTGISDAFVACMPGSETNWSICSTDGFPRILDGCSPVTRACTWCCGLHVTWMTSSWRHVRWKPGSLCALCLPCIPMATVARAWFSAWEDSAAHR